MNVFPAVRRVTKALTTVMVLTAATGCSDSSTGPTGPSVRGNWSGDFRGGTIRLTLSQNGSNVSGTLEAGPLSYAVTGEIDEGGSFTWSTEVNQTNCTSYSSVRGMLLAEEASQLEGIMVRASRALPCGSGTRTFVEQGSATLRKQF